MREVDSKNQIWFIQDGAVTRIGFTQSFIESLDQCWQVLPANLQSFKKKAPMLTVETNDALISIMAPVAGTLVRFENTARDFPDQLTADTVIMELNSLAVNGMAQMRGTAMEMTISDEVFGDFADPVNTTMLRQAEQLRQLRAEATRNERERRAAATVASTAPARPVPSSVPINWADFDTRPTVTVRNF